jgi:urease accessory protein
MRDAVALDDGPATDRPAAGAGRIEVRRVRGRTAIVSAAASSPLRIWCPRADGDAAWLMTTTLGGGLVDGDQVSVALAVGAGCAAVLSTQASTKVYRGPRGCRSELAASVGPGGLLAVLSDPVTCFSGSRYEQRADVELAPGASLAILEAVTAGRVGAGERWQFTRLRSELTVRGGAGALRDAVLLDQDQGAIARRMGRIDLLATLILAGPALAEARARVMAAIDADPVRHGPWIESATARDDMLVVRLAASEVQDGLRRMREHVADVARLVGDVFARKR